ncbi:DNA repair protein RadA [Aquihabitans sp. G128]|uniref:DNA repair protein RadA n=1 Tax=Aquihabitans sp. G128 TaxID=2849779 RepID=UPI001C21E3F5|nr:DNA repair protein RadA [Aquihabitans sp. G128]QXC59249.1 DNA repair protein RadA [Aquihabitans sp. G128]
MAKVRSVFRCSECGASEPKWTGRCNGCEAWGTLVEETDGPAVGRVSLLAPTSAPIPIAEVDPTEFVARPTGVGELDRVLGGGLVPGSVTLLGGEPGIGKSTVLLQAAAEVASSGRKVLYVSGEESPQQIRLRAERLGALHPRLWLAAEIGIAQVVGAIDQVQPDLVVIDSIQTLVNPDLTSAPGSVGQVRECSHRLVQEAKARGCAIVLVGHVTKDGNLAGPRVLEHVVDTVLAFEGDRHHALRLLRVVKHRFGSTQELGLFEMTEKGLIGVPDPSGLFLADRRVGIAGSVVVPTIEGHRPLLVELQVLAASSNLPSPRRSATGLDNGRLSLLLAVLEQRVGVSTTKHDVYALAVGGVKVVEPGVDLALGLAIVSSLTGVPVPGDLVACGEVGLGGELRQVAHTPRRLSEAARLGFHRAVVPISAPAAPAGVQEIRVGTLAEAVSRLGLLPS